MVWRAVSYLTRVMTWNIGRYRAMTMPPTITPSDAIISGSISDVSPSTAVGDLFVVEVGDLVEHLVESAGLLADGDHLHEHRREHLALGERLGDRLAFLDRRARLA